MATPFNLPLTITKGVAFGPVTFNFKQQNGDPFDLTGYTVLAYARRGHNDKNLIDLNPTVQNPATNGVAVISFTDEQTLAMMGGEYGWDLVFEQPTGERTGPYFAGPLKIQEIYTHA